MNDSKYLDWEHFETRLNAGIVTDTDIRSYLIGEALASILQAERLYSKAGCDLEFVDGLELDQIRSLIANLEKEFPHLRDPGDGTTLEMRRPQPHIHVEEWKLEHYAALRKPRYRPIEDYLDAQVKIAGSDPAMRADGLAQEQDYLKVNLAVKAMFPKKKD